MRFRLVAPSAFLAIVAAFAGGTPAQCVFGGAPGFEGCAPGGGVPPAIACTTAPAIGSGLGILLLNPWGLYPAFLIVGTTCGQFPPPAGVPMCPASSAGCYIRFAPGTEFTLVGPTVPGNSYSAPWTLPIPNDAALVGLLLCLQVAGPWAGYPACVQLSNGLSITILP